MLRRASAALVIALVPSAVRLHAQASQQASPEPPTTVVRAAAYLDVAAGKLVSPAVIVVRGERIAAVNPEAPPADATVIDLPGLTVVPGLIDCHVHLTGDLEGDFYLDAKETIADAALRGARNARLTLDAGFTTVRNVGAAGFADVSLMKAIEKGFVPGPRVIPCGHALGITGGHADTTGFKPGVLERGPESGIADGVDECIKAVRYQVKHGAQVIKICATAGVLSFEGPVGAQQFSVPELVAIVEEARRHGLKVAAHAHGDHTQYVLSRRIERSARILEMSVAERTVTFIGALPGRYRIVAMPDDVDLDSHWVAVPDSGSVRVLVRVSARH